MAAPHLLVLADLIAPFIPIGLCGSLSVIAGGLSLLFPSVWRKPLPNSLEEAENKKLIPIKERYPSFRDLKGTAFDSLPPGNGSIGTGNVYTLSPSYGKTEPKFEEMDHHSESGSNYYPVNGNQEPVIGGNVRPTALYNDDTESRLSDLEDEIQNGNWKLYGPQEGHPQSQSQLPSAVDSTGADGNRSLRDMHVFSKHNRHHPEVGPMSNNLMRSQQTHVHRVAETNL
jgi:hypothetical protein